MKNIMASSFYVLALTASLAIFGSATYPPNPYCNISWCMLGPTERQHTLCVYKPNKFGSNCGKVLKSGLTQAQITEIPNFLNEARQRVASGKEMRGKPGPQPAAKNMGKLVWSDELARIAQTWLNQCSADDSHDDCRDTAEYQVGQALAFRKTNSIELAKSTTVTDLIESWHNEVVDFDRKSVTNFIFDPRTGHYTQMMWGSTTTVGCGYITFQNGVEYKTILGCNFGPSGNGAGPVYKAT